MAKRRKKLTHKDRIFVKELIRNGGNQTDAGLAAFNAGSRGATEYHRKRASAAVIASRKMKQPHIQAALARLMDKKGLSDDKLLSELKKGVNAPTNSSTVDWHTKLRYIETGLKLRGHFDDRDKDVTQTINFLQMFIDGDPEDIDPDEYTVIEEEEPATESLGGEDS